MFAYKSQHKGLGIAKGKKIIAFELYDKVVMKICILLDYDEFNNEGSNVRCQQQ